jgi:Xaa-Pro aminopeptidase
MDYEGRLKRVRSRMSSEGVESFFVTNMVNLRYLSGFTGSTASLLVGPEAAWLFTDGRYKIRAAREVSGADVVVFASKAEYPTKLKEAASGLRGKLAFEAGAVTVKARGESIEPPEGLDRLETYFEGHELVPTKGWVEELRKVKEPEEIDRIRKAAELTDAAFNYIVEEIEVGKPERELALDIEYHMRRNGADAVSFDPIVAAAENSALPHYSPGGRTIEKGRYLLFDIGCKFEGYCSDLTRTVLIGPADDRHREIYDVVLKAQQVGLESVKAGARGDHAHAAVIKVFEDAGFPEAFSHGLGHGVGLEIHEAPNLRTGYEDVLEEGHVVTVEPGAYFEEWGGVRIEDLVVVGPDGPELLSSARKDLIVL